MIMLDNRIEEQKKLIQKLENALEKKKQLLNDRDEEIVVRQENVKKDKSNVAADVVRGKIEQFELEIEELKAQKAQAEEDIKELNIRIRASANLENAMEDIVFIHTSGIMFQIHQHQAEKFWISSTDVDFFSELEDRTECLFAINNIVELPTGIDIRLPKNFLDRYKGNNLQSLLDYCKTAVFLKQIKEDKNIFLAYKSKAIHKILKLNGIDGFKI